MGTCNLHLVGPTERDDVATEEASEVELVDGSPREPPGPPTPADERRGVGRLDADAMRTHAQGTYSALTSLLREGQEGVREHPYLPHAHLFLILLQIGVAAIAATVIAAVI